MPDFSRCHRPAVILKFINHWKSIHSELRPEVLTFTGDKGELISLKELDRLHAAIPAALSRLQQTIADAAQARQIMDSAKRAILFRAQSVARNINWKDPERSRPRIDYPSIHAKWDEFLRSLKDMAAAWETIDSGSGGPMILSGRYRRADFLAELENLTEAAAIAGKTLQIEFTERRQYEALILPVAGILQRYRKEVLARFPSSSPFVRSLPDFSPPEGSTSPPRDCRGLWKFHEEVAWIVWKPSPETAPHHYEVRYSPGDRYDPSVESVIATLRKEEPLVVLTAKGLHERGLTSLFRIYTVLESGIEAASETITVINGDED